MTTEELKKFIELAQKAEEAFSIVDRAMTTLNEVIGGYKRMIWNLLEDKFYFFSVGEFCDANNISRKSMGETIREKLKSISSERNIPCRFDGSKWLFHDSAYLILNQQLLKEENIKIPYDIESLKVFYKELDKLNNLGYNEFDKLKRIIKI